MFFCRGDTDPSLYFIRAGLIKAYYTSEDGKESVKSFLLANDMIGSLTSLNQEGVCSFSLICLQTTHLEKISFAKIRAQSEIDIQFANGMIEFLLGFARKKEQREYEFLCLSAETRYRLLANNYPHLMEQVTQNYLAGYLGVTPVGLSRIKKRTMSNNL
jgi:CRP-like cAMP-binding protein